MGNVDEKLCELCAKNKQWTRGFCSGCYKAQVRRGLLEVKKRGSSPKKLTKKQKEVLIGSLLGDGWLSDRKNSSLRINRSIKDKEYLEWEFDLFKEFCDREAWLHTKFDKAYNKEYYGISFETRASTVLATFRSKWYPKGTKIVPLDLVLTPLIIAIWFCDDGCLIYRNKKSKNKVRMPSVNFSTNSFSFKEVRFLAKSLSKRYGEKFRVNGKGNNGYVINGYGLATQKLMSEIFDYIPKCMSRKYEKWSSYLQNIK